MSGSEIVLRGGRVIDPESGFDAVADVAIGEGRVTQVGAGLPGAPTEANVAGLVVTAGFVDLHSHVNDLAGLRLPEASEKRPEKNLSMAAVKSAAPSTRPRATAPAPRN